VLATAVSPAELETVLLAQSPKLDDHDNQVPTAIPQPGQNLIPRSTLESSVLTAAVVENNARAIGMRELDYVEDLPCGDKIEPFLYALDIFLPLVDLHQEERCAFVAEAPLWRWGKAAYAILGWVVVSLTLLTISMALRNRSISSGED